jgi:pathogenesis-related protein 1
MIVYALLTVLSTLLPHVYAATLSPRENAYLAAHNSVRAAHGASPLNWSHNFAAKAVQWANACQLQLTNGALDNSPYGELQVAASGSFSVQDAVNTFVEDECR